MNNVFYPKLAANNIKKNSKTYIPYILTCIFTAAMYYIIHSLSNNEGISTLIGSDTISITLGLGNNITAIFAIIFLFYTNSFLIKRRKKEFGLFNILGMEKKHLLRVIGYETLYIALISLTLGIAIGILFDKLMYLSVLKLMGIEISLGFYISWSSILSTIILFSIIFFIIFINSLRQVHLSNPIELLKSSNFGEKEPKTKWAMAILGFVCLGLGYYIALTTKDPVAAISLFFVAVILVIVGTYLVFTAGSIAFLKVLRKNKKYYYNFKHFTSVAGMIYRMKQNAVGLANICILSTMVLVMISSTSSMMMGMEDIINTRYPYDISIYSDGSDTNKNNLLVEEIDNIISRENVEKEVSYAYLNFAGIKDKDKFLTNRNSNSVVVNDINNLIFITLEDYNKVALESKALEDGEVLLYSNRDKYEYDTINVFDKSYKIAERVDDFLGNGIISANVASSQFIVVKDMGELDDLYRAQKETFGENASEIDFMYGIDLKVDDNEKEAIYNNIIDTLNNKGFDFIGETKVGSRSSFVSLYGGLFFIGIFLGVLFIMATILIIYYKQISEGYDDKERFEIMQKVGMSNEEVQGSIRSQVLTVFFLPLITAGIHISFAFPFIVKILSMLNLTNTKLFILCTVVSFIIFALIYSVIYILTARAYYKIVRRE
ncbi:ABC transporter permease [Clostridium sartagoforme]|uniref:ABC transporter permease n=1 Tax=Clostridium sartagoforme TaxID=84031 RepID=A0A4V3RKN1_9CLOT|nr:ABC transporter permease [Clostridium sartagoforme]TGY40580.1 ABC transporter permease [Clostridium sartagoforme]